MKIAEIMTKDPLTAGPDETIKEVILKMRKKRMYQDSLLSIKTERCWEHSVKRTLQRLCLIF